MLIIVSRGLGETVTVISKDGRAMAIVHKELLIAQSDYLAEHLQELTLTLPFDEEVVATSFGYWLYRKRIHIPNAVRETSNRSIWLVVKTLGPRRQIPNEMSCK